MLFRNLELGSLYRQKPRFNKSKFHQAYQVLLKAELSMILRKTVQKNKLKAHKNHAFRNSNMSTTNQFSCLELQIQAMLQGEESLPHFCKVTSRTPKAFRKLLWSKSRKKKSS